MVAEAEFDPDKPKKPTKVKPKSVYCWTTEDVQLWLQIHCHDYYSLYSDKFRQHNVSGRVLMRFNEKHIERMGINDADHREVIWREILKLKLRTDIMEIRDMQRDMEKESLHVL